MCPSNQKREYKKIGTREFPGGPVVRILGFYCPGPGFNHWLGNQDPESRVTQPEKKRKLEKSKAQKIETDTSSLLNTNLTVFPKICHRLLSS